MKVQVEIPDGKYCLDCKFCCLDHCDYHYCAYLESMPFLKTIDPLGELKVIKNVDCPN